MAKKTKKKNNHKQVAEKPKRKFLLIFVCIFVAIVVVLGAVLGMISSIKKANAVVSYRGVTMDEETASFFVTYYKNEYMKSLTAEGIYNEDTLGFWNKDSGNGKTYGQILKEGTREFISQILVTNYLFDKYGELSEQERDLISDAAEATLEYKAGGSKGNFDEAVAEFGFSYSSFKDAARMLYKAAMAESIFCGENSENMKNYPDMIDDYISEFSHVKLLFIRTDKTYVLDEEGKRVTEAGGAYKMRELTDAEREERKLLIKEIDSYIAAIGTGEAAMGKDMFEEYVKNHDEGDASMHSSGYYFHTDSAFSNAYAASFGDITSKAYEMKIGSFAKAEEDFGVCYIYKYEPDSKDVELDALENCFSDFYTNLARRFFASTVAEYVDSVEYKSAFDEIDILALPYNYDFIPVFN